ncbi:hypothetical protein [Desulfosporosinus sp. OT]|uniref:hypothetical protein n=1 Tax=Desulfosporosinus sp. OT TaxID=913865 RepID=UPI000223A9CE|nr:hypothetical protein [Desulfosporosinus sp. OT]EGW36331.1 hypothetical protein DOT_5837 [Desulfosporosinus sp. OT]
MNPKVDDSLNKAKKWLEEFERLRLIILDCHLTEESKTRESRVEKYMQQILNGRD